MVLKAKQKINVADDDSLSEAEEECLSNTTTDISMEEIDLGLVYDPKLIWVPTKYKPNQVAQFISLMQNTNMRIKSAAKEAEVRPKQNNLKISKDHSQFLEEYIEKNPTCIIKDATEELCKEFDGMKINESAVYRHVRNELSFTLTCTQPRVAARNSEDTIESRGQFVEDLIKDNIEFRKKCVFVDESGFLRNMVRPVAWSKKGTNLSVLGCMPWYGLLALSQQVPKPTGSKKQCWSKIKTKFYIEYLLTIPSFKVNDFMDFAVSHVQLVMRKYMIKVMRKYMIKVMRKYMIKVMLNKALVLTCLLMTVITGLTTM
ncbi:hypothetical protein K501DRAFT_269734 [Backusella circina FSU 941]|nr:hypothetical protein K501DRAFT_269734 [Backusella circina FSU 941]